MSLSKEKKQARIMMHVSLIIGALCIILLVISIAMKERLTNDVRYQDSNEVTLDR